MNTLRVGFAAIAGVGCALIGMTAARSLNAREESLKAWIRVLDALEAAISYVDDPLPDVLDRAGARVTQADRRLGAVLSEAASRMRDDRALPFTEALPDAWSAGLDSSDTASLAPMIRGLGAAARQQQVAAIQSARAALGKQAESAAERTGKQTRLYRSLGTLGGLALFLTLIG